MRRRRDPLAQRRREHERLEGRARLAHALHGEVELALAIVIAADHRLDRARARVDRDERGRRAVGVGEPFRDRVACLLLEIEVDRRPHLQAAAEHLGRAVLVDQLLLDVVDEVLRRPFRAGEPHVLGLRKIGLVRLDVLRRRDLRLLEHRLQHQLASRGRGLWIRDRVVAARVGGDSRQERRLGDRQVFGAVLEVRQRRLLHAVGAVAEVDRVQVPLQDPLLRPAARPLELPGERGLAHLAPDRLLVAVERVLDELLGDRRAALDHLLLAKVGQECAADAAQVDPVVLPEAPVLDRDDRVPHRVGDLVVGDQRPSLGAAQDREDARRGLVRVVDVAVHLVVELPLRVELRDLARDRADQPKAERHRPEQPEDGEERKEAKPADPATRTRRLVPAERPQAADSSPYSPL